MKLLYKLPQTSRLILLFLSFFIMFSANAQDKHRTYLKLNYLKNTENKKLLIAELKTRIDGNFYTLQGETIIFSIAGDSIVNLGEVKTDKNGLAQIEIKDATAEGLVTYAAEYEGGDTLKARESDVEVKDVSMKMELEEVDSVKTITVSTTAEIDSETEKDISEGVEIEFFVKRMFSLLPLGKESIEEGECSIEVPDDLPGDSAGNLIIIAKIVDHDDFANVEQIAEIGWGTPVSLVTEEYNPFLGESYITFMFLAIGMVFVIVFSVSRMMKRKENQ